MGKIIYILQQISQPRCIKRIENLTAYNIPYEAYGFDRNIYNNNLKDISVKISTLNFKPSKRLKIYNIIKRWKCVYGLIKESNDKDIFYLFGFDIAILALLSFTKIKYIYEESDITYARRNKFIFSILRLIDKQIRKKSLITVFTSEGFANYFYKNNNIPANVLIQPNKLHKSLIDKNRVNTILQSADKIKFAFVGLIRYSTIFNFATTIGKYYPNHEFHFWGDTVLKREVQLLLDTYPNIFSHGSFHNPNQLENIYKKIDVLVSCYDTKNLNTTLAEPNKLYEAMFFCKPIIVSEGTFLGEKVIKLNAGYTVDAQNVNSIRTLIESLNINDLNKISMNLLNIKKEGLIDKSNQIASAIQKTFSKQ